MMTPGLREKQIECLKRMLNFNESTKDLTFNEPTWKVLVYDRFGQDIISPLLTVKELRDLGVTLHLILHSDRDAIPDVPAVYFVFPTDDNIGRICQDMQNGLYEKYYLNFISPITRHRLEDLATSALQNGAVDQISRVVDQYLNYISLEDDFFTVKHHDRSSISYYAMNKPDAEDSDIENICDTIVESLFSFLVTIGTVPVIRCPKGNAAEMVAAALDKKIRENTRDSRNSLFSSDIQSGNFSFRRPVLIILDRNNDLCTPLHHSWTYQALCHDVFELQLNRVTVKEPTPQQNGIDPPISPPQQQAKKYDLADKDKFWGIHKVSPFPTVAEAIQKELDDYRTSEEEVKKLKNKMGLQVDSEEMAEQVWSENTNALTSAVGALPELLEKKKLVDMHMNIATAMLEHIKSRKLDVLFETEEKIMSKSTLEQTVLEVLQDPEIGTPDDKLRLFIIYFLSTPNMAPADFDKHVQVLEASGCDVTCLMFIKKWKAFNKVTAAPIQTGSGQSTYSAMFSRIMSTGSQFVMEGVKSLVVGTQNLLVTRIVDSIMDSKNIPECENYRYFDPKMIKVNDASKQTKSFQEAIVFVVGGGNYIEYANLLNYQQRPGNQEKKITYGCSELLNATQFLEQLNLLGKE